MPVADLTPELALLIGAVMIVLGAAFLPHARQGWLAGAALVTLTIALGAVVVQWPAAPSLTFSGVWILDAPASLAKLVILGSGALAVAMSPDWMRSDPRHGEYYALCLFALLGAVVMAAAGDSMELLLGVLLSSAASYPLVAYHRGFAPALEAGMKYFLIGALANALLCVGVVMLFGLVGDTDYRVLAAFLAQSDRLVLSVAVGCVILGLAFKLAAFPAHAWMPDVAQAAPAPVAAMLSVAPKVGAALALARLVALLPGEQGLWLVALVSAVTMTLGNLAALRQIDVRRLLGWSSVSQSGYALMAVAVIGRAEGAVSALLVFLVAYALANLAAFAVVTHLRGRTDLADYRGLARAQPLAAVVLIVAMLSLVGIPPLVGFFGKFLLFEATLAADHAWLAIVAALNTLVSLYYYLRVAAVMVFTRPTGPVAVLGGHSRLAMLAGGVGIVASALLMELLLGASGVVMLPLPS
ncbi:NADH-quinone oxidoreductase subunit N [Halomonas sp. MCCC 1A17488]|uniref:NADH-quinone oxidoreductase subunit N n=1 Tax=unclassified Halomonas TaxID=2609666 RepID=UPI0018D26424|nr:MULTISPECIES: NADH-quinone oxidoreductase subunit N [unclassified Halomonas]MCE8016360.1 NADH-quinone oxidoreductase subunit N [Halomonas sp. MCCC 1A17488]MCG3239693.1 NADH-quinone oxidoreductase subunit N [Halomonas sp. MCCC 1A17488]QPP50398.1 NADH-quinone oxidoreductase subunit N [Halomonas sp. SS10-MC5]